MACLDDGAPFAGVIDSVALIGDDAPLTYSPDVVGPSGTFLAAGAEREGDGFRLTSFSDSADYSPTAGGTGGGGGTGEVTLISTVQGAGDESTIQGDTVTVEGIVTYVSRSGYYVQEEAADADGDTATSEALFVFTGSNSNPGDGLVAIGQTVRATGTVGEFGDLTQLSGGSTEVVDDTIQALPDSVRIQVSTGDDTGAYEAVEGMRVEVVSGEAEPLVVAANFNLDRFGEIVVSAGVMTQPTQLFDPDEELDAVQSLIEANSNNRLIVDDGDFGSNPDEFAFLPNTSPGDNGNGILDAGDDFDLGGTVRLATEIEAPIEGILSEGFGNYRVLSTETLELDEDTNVGSRPETPDDVLGNAGGAPQRDGQVVVSAFNVENYFTTLGERGASSAEDLDRQTENMVNTILASGADVLALQELENNGALDGSAVATLVDSLNAADPDGDWQFADPTGTGGEIGTDAITTGVIFDAAEVRLVASDALIFDEPSGADTFAIAELLNPFVPSGDQVQDFQRNRPGVAATFEELDTGEVFTVVSVHNKSKGDSNLQDLFDGVEAALDAGTVPADMVEMVQTSLAALGADPNFDQGDGQGFWAAVRTDASDELSVWLEETYLPGVQGDNPGLDIGSDALILGDFNAYAEEDAVDSLREFDGADADADPDYIDVIDAFVPGGQADAYSFVFDGQRGTLDQAFVSDGLAGRVTGATEWHVNADEPDLLSYDSAFTDPGFFSPDVFGASDHDPILIGLDFNDPLLI